MRIDLYANRLVCETTGFLVRLQNQYTRWTGVLIGAVGCNLIDACQSKVVFLPVDSLTFDDALTEALLFLSELAMSRVLRPGISSLIHGSDLLAVLPTGFCKSLIFQLLIRVKQILSSKTAACVILSVRSKTSCKIKHL